jgi:hypothetical protein
MKKLFLFLLAMIAYVSASAIGALEYGYTYTGVATDTVGAVITTWAKPMELNKTAGQYYMAQVKVADVDAGAKITVALQGKYFQSDSYTTIGTVTWYGGGTDTTINFAGVTNKVYYNYLNVLATRVASKGKVSYIKLILKN